MTTHEPTLIAEVRESNTIQEQEANARLIAAGPANLEQLRDAAELLQLARKYFPKAVTNSDRFKLELTIAGISKAICATTGQS